MKIAIKICLYCFTLIYYIPVKAQYNIPDLNWGTEYKPYRLFSNVFATDGTNYYQLNDNTTIIKYTLNHEVVSSIQINLPNYEASVYCINLYCMSNGDLILLYQVMFEKPYINKLFGVIIRDGKAMFPVELDSQSYGKREYYHSMNHRTTFLSADKKNILMKTKTEYTMLFQDLTKLWRKDSLFRLPSKAKSFQPYNFYIMPSGKIFSYGMAHSDSGKIFFMAMLYNPIDESTQSIDFEQHSIPTSQFTFAIQENHFLGGAIFKSTKNNQGWMIWLTRINMEKFELISETMQDLDESDLERFKSNNQEKKEEFKNPRANKIYVNKSNEIYLVTERYGTLTQETQNSSPSNYKTVTTYFYGSIVIFKFDSNGRKLWSSCIRKDHTTDLKTDCYSSASTYFVNNNIYLIYYDLPANVPDSSNQQFTKIKHINIKPFDSRHRLVCARIDSAGVIKFKLFDKKQYYFRTSYTTLSNWPISENKYIIYGTFNTDYFYNKYLRWGTLTFNHETDERK